MPMDFKQFVSAQLETIAREIGSECRGDLEQENTRVMEWVEKNAARFRAEWMRRNGLPVQDWSGRCDGVN